MQNLKQNALIFLLSLILVSGCPGMGTEAPSEINETNATPKGPSAQELEEQAKVSALNFVKNSPTYTFDCYGAFISGIIPANCEGCYKVTVGFTCSHPGYGDRSGRILAELVTGHSAEVEVKKGVVENAEVDGVWDMILQEKTGGMGTAMNQEKAELLAVKFVEATPTYKFDGSNAKVNETLAMRCQGCYDVRVNFECSHAGYGNRAGQMVAQVITPHTTQVLIESGEVKSAFTDNIWDVFKQERLDAALARNCTSDADCADGWKCFNSKQCSLLVTGTMHCGEQLGDLKCHKACSSNADCIPPEACHETNLMAGDAIATGKLCRLAPQE